MPLDFASMLLQPTKASPWNLSPDGSGSAREQLKLARERFEEEKRQNDRAEELRRIEEAGRNARSAMEAQQARAAAEATRQAALLKEQQGAMQKFGELAGSGKVQQAHAMTPYLEQLGIDANNLGTVGGLPVFQLQNRAEEAARASAEWERQPRAIDSADGTESATQSLSRMDALGYPTNERGTLDDPSATRGPSSAEGELGFEATGALDEATTDAITAGEADLATAEEFAGDGVAEVSVGRGMVPASLSRGDAFAQALAASQHARDTNKPLRGPDEEDFQGAVPRNVIDLPAMAAETNARLSPMLKSIGGSLPTRALRDTAEAVGKGAAGLGLEATDALGEFTKGMAPALDIYKSEQNIQAQKAKGNELGRMERGTLRKWGEDRGKTLYGDRAIDKSINSINKADEVDRVLNNKNREDDGMVANAVMEAQNLKGAPSNTDLEFAFNIPKGDLVTKGFAIIQEAVRGGMSDAQKAAVKSYMQAVRETQRRNLDEYLDNAFDTIDNDRSLDPEERAGFKSYVERSVPASVYNRYWEEREKREKASGGARRSSGQGATAPASGEAGAELQRQADAAGLNGQVLGQLMGGESGGATNAANDKSSAKGVFQLIDGTAQLMGYKDAAEYASEPLEKQIEVGLKLFKNKGITKDSPPEDYALVLAAPSFVGKWKSRDDVVYKKDSDEWKANAPWRPADGGDITVGSIADYYIKGGKAPAKADAPSPAQAAPNDLGLPEPKTAAEKRIIELLKKRGG